MKDSDIDLLQKGTVAKDINICAQIKDVGMKNTCSDAIYMAMALEKKDGTLCPKITNVDRRNTCMTQFSRIADATYMQDALKENNLALCAKIITPDFKTKCTDSILFRQAVANKDIATCANIKDVGMQSQCNMALKSL